MSSKTPFRKMSRPPFRTPPALSELAWRLLALEKEYKELIERFRELEKLKQDDGK
jgi:hypothetical protein